MNNQAQGAGEDSLNAEDLFNRIKEDIKQRRERQVAAFKASKQQVQNERRSKQEMRKNRNDGDLENQEDGEETEVSERAYEDEEQLDDEEEEEDAGEGDVHNAKDFGDETKTLFKQNKFTKFMTWS